LDLDPVGRQAYAVRAWLREDYHRSLKQSTSVQAGQVCLEIAPRNHIDLAIWAYVRLAFHRWQRQRAIVDAKLSIIRQALRLYRAQPTLVLPSTA
jgi:hypothetical protein